MDTISIIKGTLAIIAAVAIPGFALTLALFSKKEIDAVERAGLSLFLGMIPIVLLYALNKNSSIPINTTSTIGVILFVTAVGIIGNLRSR